VGRTLLFIGLGLAAFWVVLTVTRAVVGGLLWVVLIAAVVALAVGAFQALRGTGGTRTRTPV
jgi:hypothetical protein